MSKLASMNLLKLSLMQKVMFTGADDQLIGTWSEDKSLLALVFFVRVLKVNPEWAMDQFRGF